MQIIGDQATSSILVAISSQNDALKITLVGAGNRLTIDEGCKLSGAIFLANGASVHIGKNVKSTGAMAFHCHEGSMVEIGDDCLFSQNVQFRPSDAHKIFDLQTNVRINLPKPIRIGAQVWIGQDVLFLKGSEVAAGCIVGARSLVTRAFEESNCILAGVPAKVVRRQVKWAP